MPISRPFLSLLLIITATVAALAGNLTAAQGRAVIRSAEFGGIRSWQPEGRDALLIEGRNNQWFRATFLGSCTELPNAEAIAFVTEPNGDLNRFSSILVRGQRCWFRTLEEAPAPDTRDGRRQIDDESDEQSEEGSEGTPPAP